MKRNIFKLLAKKLSKYIDEKYTSDFERKILYSASILDIINQKSYNPDTMEVDKKVNNYYKWKHSNDIDKFISNNNIRIKDMLGFYIYLPFKSKDGLETIKELINSKDNNNILIAAEMLYKLKINK